jgi:hypothetical protein
MTLTAILDLAIDGEGRLGNAIADPKLYQRLHLSILPQPEESIFDLAK